VVDAGTSKVAKYTGEGVLLREWGNWGTGAGQFGLPFDIVFDPFARRILISDAMNRRVQIFDKEGNYLTEWGGWTDAVFKFNLPQFIAVNPVNGEIHVVDAARSFKVQRFDKHLNRLGEWGGSEAFTGLSSIVCDTQGSIYVADFSIRKVKKYSAAGVFDPEWKLNGEADVQFVFAHLHLCADEKPGVVAYSPGLLPQLKRYGALGNFEENLEPDKQNNPPSDWSLVRDFAVNFQGTGFYILEDKVLKYKIKIPTLVKAADLRISQINYRQGDSTGFVAYTYSPEGHVQQRLGGSHGDLLNFTTNENGRITLEERFTSSGAYREGRAFAYDTNDRLTQETGIWKLNNTAATATENSKTVYEYNTPGQLIKTSFYRRNAAGILNVLNNTRIYHYTDNTFNPKKIEEFDGTGALVSTTLFEYDNRINPYYNQKLPDGNEYGSVPFQSNLTRVTRMLANGTSEVDTYSYEYNDVFLPVKIVMPKQGQTMEMMLEYVAL
jgi:hypothetical protein